MIKLRHATRSFNFNQPGEVFEVPDADVAYLVETYGCEVVGAAPDVKPLDDTLGSTFDEQHDTENVEVDEDLMKDMDAMSVDPDEGDHFAVAKGGGWYEYQGRSYRFSKLPDAAVVVEDA